MSRRPVRLLAGCKPTRRGASASAAPAGRAIALFGADTVQAEWPDGIDTGIEPARPCDAEALRKRRLGSRLDGGYVVADDLGSIGAA